ncbi:MAG: hypothetical protein K2L98_02075 [Bacilli bacterium]|nr:hypothetical protein [Bacilli bacterium]
MRDKSNPSVVIRNQDENGGVSQEAADEAYNSLLSLIDQNTRSGSNVIEKWYGGSYINDKGELIIRSTDHNISSVLNIPNAIIFDDFVKPDIYPSIAYGICCKANVINRTFDIERY